MHSLVSPGRGGEDRRVRHPVVKGGVRPLGDGLRLQGRPPPPGRRVSHGEGSRVAAAVQEQPCHLRGACTMAMQQQLIKRTRWNSAKFDVISTVPPDVFQLT